MFGIRFFCIFRVESSGNWNSSMRDRNQGRRDYRDNYMGRMNHRNDRYSPADRSGDMSPPAKRIRTREWEDRYPNYDVGGYHASTNYGHRENWSHDKDDEYALFYFLLFLFFY